MNDSFLLKGTGSYMESTSCLFCNLPTSRIILERGSFTLSLCLGPVIIGHILLIHKFHTKSFSNIDIGEQESFRILRNQIKEHYSDLFGTCLFFEHGNHLSNEFSIHSHAHLHVIPVPVKNKIPVLLRRYNSIVRQNDYSIETTKWVNNREYLYYESLEDKPRFYIFSDWPKKYFVRHLITTASDDPSFFVDWETNPRLDAMSQTAKILEPVLGGLYGQV